MNNINYRKEMEKIISSFEDRVPTLLLHSCCAPCSSSCLEMLTPYFNVIVLYYNPNISIAEEYNKRLAEERRFIEEINAKGGFGNGQAFHPIQLIDGRYNPQEFLCIARGLEQCPEGGERCFKCYELRLREAAMVADMNGYDYFTTTLTVSPLKNAQKLNEIGYSINCSSSQFLPSDFKKKDGYKRSIELSHEYNLYRQNYCGCVYSKRDAT